MENGSIIVGFLNVISMLLGISLIALGGVSQFYFGNICQETLKLSISAIVMIFGGAILLLIIINLAVQRSSSTGAFEMVMVALTFVAILGGAAALTYAGIKKEIVTNTTEICINEYFANYKTNDGTRMIIDKLQTKFKCCGSEGPDFFKDQIPKSCCKNNATCTIGHKQLFTEGCTKKITTGISTNYPIILGIVGAMLGIMLISNCYSYYCIVTAYKQDHQSFSH